MPLPRCDSVVINRGRGDFIYLDRHLKMDRDEQRVRFLSLLRSIERDLENYSRRMVFDRRDCEDALQNAVLRAFRAFDRYHDDASFRA